jgi:hypothetical protein
MQSLTNNSPMFRDDVSLDLVVSHIVQPMSCRCNLRPTTLLFFGVMHLLTLLSLILFNQWLSKWSYRCNIRSTPLFSRRVTNLRKRSCQCNFWSIPLFWFWFWFYTFYAMSLAFLLLHILNNKEFYSFRVLSLQVLMRFPLIAMVLWGIQCLCLCLFQEETLSDITRR